MVPNIKVMSVFGTRPEAIKMAPIVRELQKFREVFKSKVCVTAQHRQMLDQVLELFAIRPDYDLNLMMANQSPGQVAASVLTKFEPILQAERPDWILVQGDTTTVIAAALAGFYGHTRVGHIEAGLRTYDKYHPFPEEINRRLTSVIADLHFAPTRQAGENLLKEGIPAERIKVTGNPVIDSLRFVDALPYDYATGPLRDVNWNSRIVLVTAHRRENIGIPLQNICAAVKSLAEHFCGRVQFVFPVHLNPNVQKIVLNALQDVPGVILTPPLDYLPLVYVLRRATLVLTDSGGIQEEAPAFGKPVLVLRDVTERPEGVEAGAARIVGVECDRIIKNTRVLLDNAVEYSAMAQAVNPYGDGHAAEAIVRELQSLA